DRGAGSPAPARHPAAPLRRHCRHRLHRARMVLRPGRPPAAAARPTTGRRAVTPAIRTWLGLARSLMSYRSRPWQQARLAAFYVRILPPGDLGFDIGAHAGTRSRAMLRTGARVVALEPQRLFHAFLARDLPPGVTLLPLAAGPQPGRADLAVSSLHPTVSSLASDFPGRMRGAPGFDAVRWDTR